MPGRKERQAVDVVDGVAMVKLHRTEDGLLKAHLRYFASGIRTVLFHTGCINVDNTVKKYFITSPTV